MDLALGSRPVNRHLVDLLLDFDAAAAYGTTTEVAQVGGGVCVSATRLLYRLVHPVRAGPYRPVQRFDSRFMLPASCGSHKPWKA